jgi:hypothetical protein
MPPDPDAEEQKDCQRSWGSPFRETQMSEQNVYVRLSGARAQDHGVAEKLSQQLDRRCFLKRRGKEGGRDVSREDEDGGSETAGGDKARDPRGRKGRASRCARAGATTLPPVP